MDRGLKDNPLAILDRVFFCHDLEFETVAPAVVTKLFTDGSVLVKPLVKLVNSNGEEDECKEVRLFVRTDNHGGFFVQHPVFIGDTGWMVASDRDNSLVRQYNSSEYPRENDGAQPPNKNRNLHKFSFGFFIPDKWISVAKELVKSLEYDTSKDGKVYCGGAYVIGGNRNAAGNLDYSSEFGIVRDENGNDVPYTVDEEGHTRSIDLKYKGQYFWSRFMLLASGACDIFGQGTKFSIRADGLYLNDRMFIDTHGNLIKAVRNVTGQTDDSVPIDGDIDIVGAEKSGIEVKTEVPVDSNGEPQKPRVVIDLKGRGDKDLKTNNMEFYDNNGNAIGTIHFYSDAELKLAAGAGINMVKDAESGKVLIKNIGVLGLQQGSNITITETSQGSGIFKISSSGGGGGSVPNLDVITGTSYSIVNSKLVATVTKTNLQSLQTSTSNIDVFTISSIDVVTNTDYTSPDFKQYKKSVSVIGNPGNEVGSNVFTTTPLTSEGT